MMRSMRLLTAATALAATSACGGNMVLISEPVYQQLYTVEDFQLAALNGEIMTRVFGNPFAVPRDSFAGLVTGMMKGANLGREVIFTGTPAGRGSGYYHVALAFNPTPRTTADEICAGPPADPPVTGPVTLLAAFCRSDGLKSTADGSAGNLSGPEDPRFRELVRGVTLALFPAYDHWDIGGDGGSNTD